ncbi:hypothetical protein P5V65_08880 [Mycobacteroides abscessus subsp. abscessus]|uniref:hypothetical protein n=1 Tax=Mycobacteroides abscessus TaxID=36809 RepID=UPI00266D9E8E|nr:hypothetical protein [Mycobacteroides abscessus]MDO3019343.1 hypothetical protein [Mycobacteroides abscessus subsp. abscessus]
MSEKPQMSEAEQLAHDREAMSALAPKLRGLVERMNSDAEEAQAKISVVRRGNLDPGLAALISVSDALTEVGRATAARISAMAAVSELGAVAQTTGQVDALRARIESWPPLWNEDSEGGESLH